MKQFSLRTVRYVGEYRNDFVTLDNRGLLPSISRLLNKGLETKPDSKLNEKIGINKDKAPPKEETAKDKSNFKYFWKFMANNETFLIPHDHEMFEDGTLDRQLLFDLINGRQNKVLDFDFTQNEEFYNAMKVMVTEVFKEVAESTGEVFNTEEEKKKRAYMYFHPNREFSGKFESLKLKKVDDGTFIDNGYR